MLVESMNDQEVTKEIYSDYEALVRTSLERIGDQYNKERKKKKIPVTDQYTKIDEIKTKKKNRWLVFSGKPPSVERYNGDACNCFITYYHTPYGLRVFKIIPYTNNMLSVFHTHMFQRYGERMGLSITNTLDLVKHFFTYNGFLTYKFFPEPLTTFSLGKCRDGLLLGNLENSGKWVVNRTFITNQLMKEDQDEIADNMMASLQDKIESILNQDTFNKDKYDYLADTIKGLK